MVHVFMFVIAFIILTNNINCNIKLEIDNLFYLQQ